MFKDYFIKTLLAEALTREIKDFLDSDLKLSDKHEGINYYGASLKGRGSSRNYYKFDTPKKISLDGEPISVEHGVKIPIISNLDHYHSNEIFGKQQNKNESLTAFNSHRTLIKNGKEYKTNENGVLAPVFSSHPEGKWIEMAHVEPIENKNYNEEKTKEINQRFKNSIQNKDFPDITWNDIHGSLKRLEQTKHNNNVLDDNDKKILDKHPVAKGLSKLIGNTSISAYDLTRDNIGLWKHPKTKKDHVVVLDYGASRKLLSDYDDATEKFFNGSEKRQLNEFTDDFKKSLSTKIVGDNLDRKTMNNIIPSIRKEDINTGTYGVLNHGSTRSYIKSKTNKSIVLDDKESKVPYGMKISRGDNYKKYNEYEASPSFNKFSFFKKIKKDHYTTNEKNGILVPTFNKSKNNTWLETLHVKPLDEHMRTDPKIFNKLTKTKEMPEGLDFHRFFGSLLDHYHNSFYNKHYDIDEKYKNHPLFKKAVKLLKETPTLPTDLNEYNWGILKHPHTGKLHPVILDWGHYKEPIKENLNNEN